MATKRSQAAWLSQLLTEWAGTDVVVAGDKVRRETGNRREPHALSLGHPTDNPPTQVTPIAGRS